MKINGLIHELYRVKCIQDCLTREEASKFFKTSWQFLYAVLTYKRPMPEWMVAKMAEFLDIPEGVVGIAYGYYPEEWVELCRTQPDVIHKSMHTLLKTLSPDPDVNLSSVKSKTLSHA